VAELLAALLLVAVHLGAGLVSGLQRTPRSRWLSVAGGMAVAYVFAHLLPELARLSGLVARSLRVEEGIFAVALAGLIVFYGLERWAIVSRHARRSRGEDDCTPPAVFWLHIVSFSVYNAIVGYLLTDPGAALWLFTLAMALHFLVNDDALRRHHRARYHRFGRWILAAAVVTGLGMGRLVPVGELSLALLLAFLAGGVVLNTLKEEVPAERESRFWSFAAGAAAYTALVLLAG
jgi:hypothetical protein